MHLIRKYPGGSNLPAFIDLKYRFIETDEEYEDVRKPKDFLGGPQTHGHDHLHTDLNVCECMDEGKQVVHDKILASISTLEHLSDELERAHGVTAILETKVKPAKRLDLKTPRDGRRGLLGTLSRRVTTFFLGDEE